MQRHLRRVALAGAVLVATASIAACGSSSPSVNAQRLLSQTFRANLSKIHSGTLSLTISAKLNGLRSLHGQPVSLQLSGPFSVGSSSGTKFDFGATVTVSGTTLPVGLLSTGRATYVEVAGTYYSAPASVASGLAALSGSSGTSANLLTTLGINPLSWLTNAQYAGTKMVGGVASDHLTAQLDVRGLLSDVAKLAGHASALIGSSLSTELSPSNLDQLASTISSARVDIYTGASDHVLRGFSTAIAFEIPLIGQSSLGGLTGGQIALDVTITNLNAPETFTGPSSSQPFSDLLGGSGGLAGL